MKLRTDTADGPNRRFSRGLAVLRRRAGLTQKAVSIAVWGVESMSDSRISNIETFQHGVSLGTAYLLAKALNTTIDAVIAAGECP